MFGNKPSTSAPPAMEPSNTLPSAAAHLSLFGKVKKRLAHFREEWGPLLAAKTAWDDEYNFAEGRYAGQPEEVGHVHKEKQKRKGSVGSTTSE
ncbi:hypothetical protein BJY01DRAFT_212458 [Aspergillus pseudoustus]|uniref:Uncharacterized protein n=1 Tax=Aspergillus pseudoustus TaxID=1810923 RepID=A0ABR4K5A5_9EURO